MTLQISDEYIDHLITLFENVRDNQFEIGDTLVLLVDSSPEQRSEIINYAASKLAVASSTLYDYENTARRWSLDKRREYASLDFTIYRNSDPTINKDLLDQAIDEGWNATTFKEQMFPALTEPSNQIERVMRILQKILKEELSDEIVERIRTVIVTLSEIRDVLDGEV